MIGGGESGGGVVVRFGAFDEVVVDDIDGVVGGGVAAGEAGVAPVVDEVVDVLDGGFDCGIAALVVEPEVVGEGDAFDGVYEGAEALGVDGGADDTVFDGDVVAAFGEAHGVPAAPLDGAVVEDDVVDGCHVNGAFARVAVDALAEAEVADDDVVMVGEGSGAVVEADALTGGGLAEDGGVVGDVDVGLEGDDAREVKDDGAVGL